MDYTCHYTIVCDLEKFSHIICLSPERRKRLSLLFRVVATGDNSVSFVVIKGGVSRGTAIEDMCPRRSKIILNNNDLILT